MSTALALATESIMPGVTDSQFYQEMQKLRDLIDRRANDLERKLEDHANEDRLVANNVNTIMTERRLEAGAATKRLSWIMLGGSAGVTLGIQLLRKLLNI